LLIGVEAYDGPLASLIWIYALVEFANPNCATLATAEVSAATSTLYTPLTLSRMEDFFLMETDLVYERQLQTRLKTFL